MAKNTYWCTKYRNTLGNLLGATHPAIQLSNDPKMNLSFIADLQITDKNENFKN
jgi:hypothetical protein